MKKIIPEFACISQSSIDLMQYKSATQQKIDQGVKAGNQKLKTKNQKPSQ
jgi:hypothetical protein